MSARGLRHGGGIKNDSSLSGSSAGEEGRRASVRSGVSRKSRRRSGGNDNLGSRSSHNNKGLRTRHRGRTSRNLDRSVRAESRGHRPSTRGRVLGRGTLRDHRVARRSTLGDSLGDGGSVGLSISDRSPRQDKTSVNFKT